MREVRAQRRHAPSPPERAALSITWAALYLPIDLYNDGHLTTNMNGARTPRA